MSSKGLLDIIYKTKFLFSISDSVQNVSTHASNFGQIFDTYGKNNDTSWTHIGHIFDTF